MIRAHLTIHLRIKNGSAKVNALAFLKHARFHHSNDLLRFLLNKKAVQLIDNQWHAMMTFADVKRLIEAFDDQYRLRIY